MVLPRAAWTSAIIACGACGGGEAPGVRLVPVGDGPCGRPAEGRSLLVTPLGDFPSQRRPIALGAPVALADLPAETRQLAVEVLGDGAEVLAQGKTAPFVMSALADGDTLAVAMVPPDGFCPSATLLEARDRPLLAPAGGGVLIAGGYAPLPLATAEWFDPSTDSVRRVELPAGFVGPRGLAGASLVPLADGTVALVGGPSPGFAIYDPEAGEFGDAVLVSQVRAHAAAVALDDGRVMLLGGCGTLRDDGRCEAGAVRADARFLDLANGGAITEAPPLVAERAGGTAFFERGPDGRRAVVLVGGVDNAGAAVPTAERIGLDDGLVTVLGGAGAGAARLDSGAIVTAFAPDQAVAHGETAVLVPGVEVARPLPALALARTGAVLVTQEDGLVIGFGGGQPLRYLPASSSWSVLLGAAPALEGGHAAVRLDDGSVWIAGGRLGLPVAAQRTTWRFRPRLLGPFTGSLSVVPGDDESEPPLAPLDPVAAMPGPPWRLSGGGPLPSHAVVGGPVGGSMIVDVRAGVPAEGIGLIFGHTGPADHHLVRLTPGTAAVVERELAGVTSVPCQGQPVPAGGPSTLLTLNLDGSSVRVAMAGQVVLTCTVGELPPGRIGVAAFGAGTVEVMSIAVSRP